MYSARIELEIWGPAVAKRPCDMFVLFGAIRLAVFIPFLLTKWMYLYITHCGETNRILERKHIQFIGIRIWASKVHFQSTSIPYSTYIFSRIFCVLFWELKINLHNFVPHAWKFYWFKFFCATENASVAYKLHFGLVFIYPFYVCVSIQNRF